MAMLARILSRKFNTSARFNAAGSKEFNEHAAKAAVLWKNISLFVAIPAVLLGTINMYFVLKDHHPERPDFLPYEYMRIRRSKFPWGDGNHTLFHNKHVNALPGVGYED